MIAAELLCASKRLGSSLVLDGVSFAVGEGTVVALLGPNGAGKSTAIALLLGLRRPDSGVAVLFGKNPRDAAARGRLGVMPQDLAFPATLRVGEVVDLVRAHYEQPLPAPLVVAGFGLDDLVRRQVGGLSGGERRRLGVALAFAGDPRLVVLDEPTAGLDRQSRRAVWDAIRARADGGGAVLLSTHYLEEADALADRIVRIARGRIVDEGTSIELKAAAGLTMVRFRAEAGLEVEGAVRHGAFLSLVTEDGAATVDRLARDGVPLVELEVRPLTLEEALGLSEAHP